MSLKTIGIYGAIVAATLVSAELLARVYDWSPGALDATSGDRLGSGRYYHSFEGAGDLVPNQDGHWVIWFHRPYHVQTNSAGLRNAEEPNAKAFRVLALGDSQTFGPYMANEDAWPAWAENALRDASAGGQAIQVFNGGIAGYTITDELALLREKGIAFKPKLVVLAVFENDVADLGRKLQRPPSGTEARLTIGLKSLARSSALVNLANAVKARMQLAAAGADIRRGEANPIAPREKGVADPALASRYGENFRTFFALAKANGIALAVIFIPSADNLKDDSSKTRPVITALAAEMKTPFLDLTLLLQRDPDENKTRKFSDNPT